MGTSRKRSGGGGGGGEAVVTTKETLVKVTRERFSVAHNFIDEDDFEDIAGMPAWGENTKRAFLNFGADDDGDAGTAQWARVEKEEFDAWIVSDAGSSPAATTGMHFRDFTSNSPTAITTTTRDFFIGKDADDKFIIASSTVNEDASPLTVIFENEEEVDVVTGVTGDVADGRGVAPGWIEPKDEYVADDLGKFLLENGILKHIVLEAHEGHSRVVEFQTLANAVSALDADGNNIATGGAGNFLGFFPNLSSIPALSIADEVWAALTGAGDFEIQDPTGFYASEHWNSYNPFRGAGDRPWATITKADTTTQDHVAFTDPDTGIISDWRVVNITQHAERYTTAVGEAFFIQDEQKIKMVIAYTPHLEGEVQYVSEPYLAPGTGPHSVAIFWGKGQVADAPDRIARTAFDIYGGYYRLEFNSNDPDDFLFDGNLIGAEILDAADISADISLITTPAGTTNDEVSVADKTVLELTPGTYNLKFHGYFDGATNTTFGVFLFEVMAGVDEDFLLNAFGYNQPVASPIAAGEANLPYTPNFEKRIVITETTQFSLVAGTFGSDLRDMMMAYTLEVEKIA